MSDRMFLYMEKEPSMSTLAVGQYLNMATSSGLMSSEMVLVVPESTLEMVLMRLYPGFLFSTLSSLVLNHKQRLVEMYRIRIWIRKCSDSRGFRLGFGFDSDSSFLDSIHSCFDNSCFVLLFLWHWLVATVLCQKEQKSKKRLFWRPKR